MFPKTVFYSPEQKTLENMFGNLVLFYSWCSTCSQNLIFREHLKPVSPIFHYLHNKKKRVVLWVFIRLALIFFMFSRTSIFLWSLHHHHQHIHCREKQPSTSFLLLSNQNNTTKREKNLWKNNENFLKN